MGGVEKVNYHFYHILIMHKHKNLKSFINSIFIDMSFLEQKKRILEQQKQFQRQQQQQRSYYGYSPSQAPPPNSQRNVNFPPPTYKSYQYPF